MEIVIYTDGGSRGNPGKASIAGVVKTNGSIVFTVTKYLGIATNNDAEYQAVIETLSVLIKKIKEGTIRDHISTITVFSDSNLMVSQLNGTYKVKNSKIRLYVLNIRSLENELPCSVRYVSIPREQNTEADALVNRVLNSVM